MKNLAQDRWVRVTESQPATILGFSLPFIPLSTLLLGSSPAVIVSAPSVGEPTHCSSCKIEIQRPAPIICWEDFASREFVLGRYYACPHGHSNCFPLMGLASACLRPSFNVLCTTYVYPCIVTVQYLLQVDRKRSHHGATLEKRGRRIMSVITLSPAVTSARYPYVRTTSSSWYVVCTRYFRVAEYCIRLRPCVLASNSVAFS